MNIQRPAPPNASPVPRAISGALPEGTVFAGRYRIVRAIAAGGMGAVYEVVHTETERRRALKIMHPHMFQSDEMRERFKREARIAAQVESEYIVDVSDAGVDEATKTPFLVMELLQGEELGHRLRRLGRLPPAEALTYLHQVALALDKTHAKLIVHRDLKPDNIFLTVREDGSLRVKILDFGVAKVVAEGATAAGATRSLGTPLYMAPEQFRVGSKLLPTADIYALGMMAYTLLVGQPYWAPEAKNAGDVIAFAMVVVGGPQESAVQRAAQVGVALPPSFDGWFARATAVSPEYRFPRASEAVWALREALGGQWQTGAVAAAITGFSGGSGPQQAVPAGLERASTSTGAAVGLIPPTRSRGPVIAAAALLGVAVLGVGVWLGLRAMNGPSPAPGTTSPAATSAGVAAAAPTFATTAPPAPLVVPAPTESASASPSPQPQAPGSAVTARPTSTGTLPAAPATVKPITTATAKPATTPTAKPTTTPTAKPLLGRD